MRSEDKLKKPASCGPFQVHFLFEIGRSVAGAVRHFSDQREERKIHSDDYRSDRDSKKTDQNRFHKRQQVSNRCVYFLFVEVSDLTKHSVERARLFTDAYHLRHHVWKDRCGFEWIDKTFTAFNSTAYLGNSFFDNYIASGFRGDVQRLKD